uniref:ComEC/Rec2 family competence protein n=1 Tax=Phocaeicola vulgatus TaxID=821 RepID=UPI00402665C1
MDLVINYQVEMLNVGAADAFIIYYTCIDNQHHITNRLILIDGGNYSDGDNIIEHINKYYPRRGFIDLIIVTHPDDDHIGGVVRILEALRDKKAGYLDVDNIAINDPSIHGYIPSDVKNKVMDKTLEKRLKSAYDVKGDSSKNLLNLIDSLKIQRNEVFAGDSHHFMPIKILGPNEDYYKSLIPDFRGINLNFKDASYPDINTGYDDSKDTQSNSSLSPTLDATSDDTSAPNRSSIIFTFIPNTNTKFLFTGDACRESFENIPDGLEKYYNNVTWLKVPHHGSAHNLDTEMIKVFNPTIAYISTEKEGHYLDRCTINALKRNNTHVYSTHKYGSMLSFGFQERDDYHTVSPM